MSLYNCSFTVARQLICSTLTRFQQSFSKDESGPKPPSMAQHSSMSSPSDVYRPAIDTSQAIQGHPAVYEAMSVHKNSEVVELFGDLRSLPGSSSPQSRMFLPEVTAQSLATVPTYLLQSRLAHEDSPLSKVFTGFRDAARQMIATGTPPLDIINGSSVICDLYFRERFPSDGFTCSSWASEVCRNVGLEEIDEFVRLGWLFLLARLMRVSGACVDCDALLTFPQWMIFPTAQTYSEVPTCQRPTPTQLLIPHMPAIDLHPMPAFRDMLCSRLQDWMTPMVSVGLSCNWPFTMQEALETDPSGSVKISQRFAAHVAQCENWSINSHGSVLYPELAGKVRIQDG